MTNTRLQRLFILLTALLALSGLATAQTPVEPVILNFDGDLWAWEGAGQPLTQLTDWGHNYNPTLSPDGTRIAYTSYASLFIDWLKTVQGAGGFLPPANIWILDLPSRQTFRVADQPADASFNGPDAAGKHIVRQDIMWSPDGGSVAWIDIVIDSADVITDAHTNTIRVTAYDLVSRRTQHLTTFLAADSSRRAGIEHRGLAWTESGIVVETRPQPGESATTYRVYTAAGDRMTQYKVDGTSNGRRVRHDGRDYVVFNNGQSLDLTDGTFGAMPGRLEMYSLTAPDGAYFTSPDGDLWTLHLPGQAAVELGDDVRPFSIARDGMAAVYGRYELIPALESYGYTIIHHSAAGAVEIGGYRNMSVLAGPVGWRVAED